MRIGIIDADLLGRKYHAFPNLVCMKLSSYWKSRNAEVVMKTDYEHLEEYDKVYIAKVFTDTAIPAEVLDRTNVEYGGTGFFYDQAVPLPYEIEHSQPDYEFYSRWLTEQPYTQYTKQKYYREYSIGYLTRGCCRHCSFCVNRASNKSQKHSPLKEFLEPTREKICLLDDNFLASSEWKELLIELKQTGKAFQFKQGLDARLLDEEKSGLLFSSKYDGDYIFSYDDARETAVIEEKLKLIRSYTHRSVKFYVLCGYDREGRYDLEFWKRDMKELFSRIMLLGENRCIPYVMRYARYKESPYKRLYDVISRWCNNPKFIKTVSLMEFVGNEKNRHKTYQADIERYVKENEENAMYVIERAWKHAAEWG